MTWRNYFQLANAGWEQALKPEQKLKPQEVHTMFNVSKLKNSRFAKKDDVGDGLLVTIQSITEEDVGLDSPEIKYAVNFKEDIKPMILNATNGECIAEICGGGTEADWIGKQIVLYDDPNVMFAGKRCGGIRVRAPKAEAPANDAATEDIPF